MSSHSRDHNGDILRAWRRCDGAGTTATFDGVALGGQCHQQLDGDGERLCVANKVDEMASRLTMGLLHQDGVGGYRCDEDMLFTDAGSSAASVSFSTRTSGST